MSLALDGILAVLAYLLVIGVLALLAFVAIAVGLGLVVALGSVPPLYVLPDVRRFFVRATGGRVADGRALWRVATRRRYLGLSIGVGLAYGITALSIFGPLADLGLVGASVGPVPVLLSVPVAFGLLALGAGVLAHRASSAWTETTSVRSVLLQWTVLVTVVVALVTAVPFAVLWLWQYGPS